MPRKRNLRRVAAPTAPRYERVMCSVPGAAVVLLLLITVTSQQGCESVPPAMTGITIYTGNRDGAPGGLDMARTRVQPPIPLIAVCGGTDPRLGSLLLNEPRTGNIAVTLARGIQHFLLFTEPLNDAPPAVIALFLEGETAPALTCVVEGSAAHTCVASRAPVVMGLEGAPVANHSSLTTVRKGFRVSIREAVFPLPDIAVDVISPWLLYPDNVIDAAGVITIAVQPTELDGHDS